MSTFDIESIRVENFKSFKGKHDFVFPDEEGFYSIAGKNEVQPRLGPNGAGKTSFIDALFWCLYGKTPAGLKASDVCSWGVKGRCRVSSRIVVADNGLVVTRTQSPNSLTVSINDGSPTPIEQDKLNELLRLTDEEFPFAVMIPQSGEDMFFDLKPNRKLALFSKVLKLDFWLDKSVVAQRDAEKILARIREKNTKLSHNNGQIESLEDTLDILREKSEQFEEDRKSKLAELRTVSKEVARSLETGEEPKR
jgi:DNA repair exonuclease SbcCD ATPase subunit